MSTQEDTYELACILGQTALRRGFKLATAESCTAGGVGFAITAVAGSSQWFDRGFITYTNEAKHEMLGVSNDTLNRYGAVSCETAREMASGALQHSQADAAVSVTGIAGPGGEVPGKPVGTVCFGTAVRAGSVLRVRGVRMHFDGCRDDVRRQSIDFAIRMLNEEIDQTQ